MLQVSMHIRVKSLDTLSHLFQWESLCKPLTGTACVTVHDYLNVKKHTTVRHNAFSAPSTVKCVVSLSNRTNCKWIYSSYTLCVCIWMTYRLKHFIYFFSCHYAFIWEAHDFSQKLSDTSLILVIISLDYMIYCVFRTKCKALNWIVGVYSGIAACWYST